MSNIIRVERVESDDSFNVDVNGTLIDIMNAVYFVMKDLSDQSGMDYGFLVDALKSFDDVDETMVN